MYRQQKGRFAAMAAAFLMALLAAVVCGWAQKNDTPIVILDGSLSMESAVPWSQFKGTGDQRTHPDGTRTITKVVVTLEGKEQTLAFSKEKCTVEFLYGGKKITVSTGNNGQGLRITPFSAFQNGETPNHLRHKDQTSKISHVTVTKGNAKVLDAAASGHTKIVISYQ